MYKEISKSKLKYTKWLLLAMYVAGIIGLSIEFTRSLFELLVPFNLLFTGLLIFYFQKEKSKSFLLFYIIIAFCGYLVEVFGVHSGIIFGRYSYGPTLGFKVGEVPLIIGINWVVLIICTAVFMDSFSIPNFLKPILSALLMVLLDVFIEPVAVKFNFWQWENGIIPIQNFIAWGVVAYIFHLLFQKFSFNKTNPIAKWTLMCQFLFFISHNLISLLS